MATTTNGPALTKQATTENYDVGVVNANSDLIADLLSHKGTDILSASTITIPAVGSAFDVTSTTGIGGATSTKNYAGRVVLLHFDSALVLTHGANWHLPNNATNITTAANDRAIVISEGSDAWRFLVYQRATGAPLSITGSLGTAGQQLRMNSGATAPEWAYFITNIQADSGANTPTTARLRAEVGIVTIAGDTGASSVEQAITFSAAFSGLQCILLGAGSAGAVGGDRVVWAYHTEGTSGFTLRASTTDAGVFASTATGDCRWMAIGVV